MLGLQPALYRIAAYVCNIWDAKEQSKTILLNLISTRTSTEKPRYGATKILTRLAP